jgi:glutathione S-transferase
VTLRLLGTTTSPYTRKVRILLAAAKLPFTLVDTREDEGSGLLVRLGPIGKVPVLLMGEPEGGESLPDSGLIAQRLWADHGPVLRGAGFVLDPNAWQDRTMQTVVEGALDAAINRFYMKRDGFADTGYVARQRDRVEHLVKWLADKVPFTRPCTATILSLGCALDWMVFRKVVELPAGLVAFREAWTKSGLGAGTEPG